VVSVLNFEDRIHLPEFAWMRRGLADMLITDLSQAPGVKVVQRERLDDVMREQSLQAGGRVEEKSAVRIGRLTGATLMLLGSATRVGDILRLDAHLLDVERGTVLGATSVEGRLDEVLVLEKQLATRVLAFLQRDSGWQAASPAHPYPPSRDAAEALYRDLAATGRGNIDEALAGFEADLKKNPRYADGERRYERALRKVETARLWSRGFAKDGEDHDRVRLGTRLADDLFKEGLVAEVDPEGASNTGALQILLRFDGETVERVRQEIEQLGGTAVEQGGALVLRLPQSEIRSAFVRAMEGRRRVFLHLQAPDGRQVAIYSRLKEWEGQDWVWIANGGDVVLDIGHRFMQTLTLPGMAFEGLPLSLWITLERVPHEQAVLQVDLIRTGDDGREMILMPRAEGPVLDAALKSGLSESELEELLMALRREFERFWNPNVWERTPGPGYLPSARRSIMVSAQIQKRKPTAARILGASGDRSYDEACLSAVADADSSRLAPLLAQLERVEGAMRVRVTCDLRKDIPSLVDAP
ncbi:MAG TPA: CsgG/HfaB family protein, partial [Nitrospirales bacterium]